MSDNDGKQIAWHIKTGELESSNSFEFHCKICDVPLVQQPMAHIIGGPHRNKVFFEVLKDKVKYLLLFADLPKSVREAHSKGMITVDGLSIVCKVCEKALSGEKPVNDHFISSNHNKKVQLLQRNFADNPGVLRSAESSTNITFQQVVGKVKELNRSVVIASVADRNPKVENTSQVLHDTRYVAKESGLNLELDSKTGKTNPFSKTRDVVIPSILNIQERTGSVLNTRPVKSEPLKQNVDIPNIKNLSDKPSNSTSAHNISIPRVVPNRNETRTSNIIKYDNPNICDIGTTSTVVNSSLGLVAPSIYTREASSALRQLSISNSDGNDFATSDSVQKAIQEAIANAHVKVGSEPNHFFCVICEIGLTGDVPLQQHLRGKAHNKNLKKAIESDHFLSGVLTSSVQHQPLQHQEILHTNPQPQINISFNHYPTTTTPTRPARAIEISHPMNLPYYNATSTMLPPIIGSEIQPIHTNVRRTGSRGPTFPMFSTSLLPVENESNALLMHHQEPLLLQNQFHTTLPQLEPLQQRQNNPSVFGHGLQEMNVRHEDDQLASVNFETESLSSTESRGNDVYQLRSNPRGIVAIFNYKFDDDPAWRRDGASHDSVNLFKIFKAMSYEVFVYDNFSKEDTFSQLDIIISSELRHIDSLILFFLSHGKNECEFYASDKELICISDIWRKLTDSNCPSMQDKPKLLILNYCRGDKQQSNKIYYDNRVGEEEEAPRDLAIIQATLPGFKAAGLPNEGTIFVTCFCEVIQRGAKSCDLHTIVYDTSQLMQKKKGTTASVRNIDFRKFYFID